jgi:membrane glycosyltransferase
MPRRFYMVTSFVVIAYFTYEGLGTILAHWRVRYREERSDVPPAIFRIRPVESSAGVLAVELFEFFAHRMWWWLTPTIFVLTLFISLAMLNRSSVIAVTPFMYTIF